MATSPRSVATPRIGRRLRLTLPCLRVTGFLLATRRALKFSLTMPTCCAWLSIPRPTSRSSRPRKFRFNLEAAWRDGEKLSLEQIRAFVEGSSEIRFKGKDREEVYGWMTRVLRQHGYARQGREVKGLLRRYLGRMTGLSRAQVTRL